ncbi:MAG: group II intron reverse transcriptase/maturase [Acidobacteriota bacterium]|nr:group II intron reverse transcriptase/maturase [Acidobacteriota bacterium]
MNEPTNRTQNREIASRGLPGVREAAQRDKGLRFTTLLHHVNERLLLDSFYLLKRQAAPGVDRVTWGEYEEGVEGRITDLHGRLHRGAYRAQPSRRVYIPKPDGRQRPLGIAALEDKIVQQAVVTVLHQIYEEDFLGFSYGFRPGRGAHDALDSLTAGIVMKKVNWILDADIKGFFDNISHEKLMELVELRIADPRILRLIGKWLTAGVSEDGQWSETKVGTPQGAVISPLLANIYLHYVLDQWVIEWRKVQANGDVIIVRYADDFVMGFQYRDQAERFLRQLQKRMAEYGLELHSDKTRLIQFGRFAAADRKRDGAGKPETFNFLGFTHICGTIWKSGKFTVHRKTVGKRMTAKLQHIATKLRKRAHDPIAETGDWLTQVVRGYFNYHAIPGNLQRLQTFRWETARHWLFTVRRRSQRSRWTKERFQPLIDRYLPRPRILHPYPLDRFTAKYPR